MSGIKTVIEIITYLLIAFVMISFVVSGIMIAIVTYISYLERRKEIGILRAIGACKRDIIKVFSSEAIIEGLLSGLMGIMMTYSLILIINYGTDYFLQIETIAKLDFRFAIMLIFLSVLITVISALIPAIIASRCSIVDSLKQE